MVNAVIPLSGFRSVSIMSVSLDLSNHFRAKFAHLCPLQKDPTMKAAAQQYYARHECGIIPKNKRPKAAG